MQQRSFLVVGDGEQQLVYSRVHLGIDDVFVQEVRLAELARIPANRTAPFERPFLAVMWRMQWPKTTRSVSSAAGSRLELQRRLKL